MSFTWSAKDPDEVYPYEHDWAKRLLGPDGVDIGDTIVPVDDPDLTKRPSAEVVEGDVVVDEIVAVPGSAKLQYWVSAGTEKSKITATIWTAQECKYQETFVLPIKQR